MRLLLERGVGIEAGIWTAGAANTFLMSGLAPHCLRLLLEPGDVSTVQATAVLDNLEQMERVLQGVDRPRLLHGLDESAWDMLVLAAQRGYDARIGFEDTLTLPDGSQALSNTDLVAAATQILNKFH